MIDPYARDRPGVADPANNLIPIVPDDGNDLILGIKALRIAARRHAAKLMKGLVFEGRGTAFARCTAPKRRLP
jgi:hypothetical protein